MIEIDVPGYRKFRLSHLVLDVNGTIAKDGQLIDGVHELLAKLGSQIEVHMITADTHGRQEVINRQLNLTAVSIPVQKQAEAKLDYINKLGTDSVVAVGNGANDALMLEHAALGIGIIGAEGAAGITLQKADVVVTDTRSALELLLYPKRLMATLRR
ncbi:MAG TPA: ATPase P [Acidobacteriota bacterium]|nr:ATPase P [Acidobacteriota bacterium]